MRDPNAPETATEYANRIGYENGWEDCENKHRAFAAERKEHLRSAIDLLEKAADELKKAMML